ncbi:carbon-nitrogen hydrolase family protein [Ensifer adhaerens]|uniref:carbon-nitrogen hydrolase family protein n=1 Tax=Ensifer adhaerens TaxID=106592 RepID=UPI003CD03BAA
MIVFSELASHGPLHACMAWDPEADISIFRELASMNGVWLVPGSMFIRRDGKIYNQAVVIDPSGAIVGRCDNLFPFVPTEVRTADSRDFLVFDIPFVGRCGISICHDVWFPEIARTLSNLGVEVLLRPALTGTTDRPGEMAVVQSTAEVLRCYVFNVNGLDAGGVGQSLVVDPTGRIVHQGGQNPEIFCINVDFSLVRQTRAGAQPSRPSVQTISVPFDRPRR